MEHYFPGIRFVAMLGNRPGVPTKPDPTIVKEILQISGISSDETLYAGDTSVDMNTATAAGLSKIGVLWGFRTKEELVAAGADFLVEKPEEILKIIGISNSKSNN